MIIDPLYLIMIAPVMVLVIIAQLMVTRSFKKYSQVAARSGVSGAEAAAIMLRKSGVTDVGIEQVAGMLSDHYDPTKRVLRLSPDVYGGRSLSALGVACHEAGHALQHAQGYTPLYIRNVMVPVASFGSTGGIWLMVLGSMFAVGGGFLGGTLAMIGFYTFLVAVLFSLVTLPVEFDASRRAKRQLAEIGLISGPAEERAVAKVLNAAAMTYVAAAAMALMQLLYWAVRLGLLGGRSDE